MKNVSRHTEWLSLIEVSGPFLTVSMLEKVFPQGLEVVGTPKRQLLRAAYDEWCDAVDENDTLLSELHREWIRLVLVETLEYDDTVMKPNGERGVRFDYTPLENTGTFAPDQVVFGADGNPRLFVSIQLPGTDLETMRCGDGWPVSLAERMSLLCRHHGVRLGLLTNGERWMLVNAPVGATSSQVSWYARLWFQEPTTLKAFVSLFGVRRCFGPEGETLEALLEESLEHQEEVTDTLGEQVRRAVEVLVQCLDKADEDRNRELLRDVSPAELYEAGLTVMMRLVFVLCAEERGLLLSGDLVYDQCYAVSTLRGQLAEESDLHGPEVLDRRHDAWSRLLASFRAVYGGIEHESLRMPALGGSLFDPDKFPFLEGRRKNTKWLDTAAIPLPIDNRTVLMLLDALQVLEQSGGAVLLSYKALDVEQIGHVYEGLLEHTVARTPQVTLGLTGSRKAKNPNLPLGEIESARMDGLETLVELLKSATERSEAAIKNALERPVDDDMFARIVAVCGGDMGIAQRIRPFVNLLRIDAWGDLIVYRANAFMVTLGADRRETGTHYTPKSLTENIVSSALEPVTYSGPVEGKARDEWELKIPSELLDLKICDPAMGSGAFLVQVCRWLGERLVEAWGRQESLGKFITTDGEVKEHADGAEPMPSQLDERMLLAKRLIAERCIYGVDINPLAVELAKLSIWLVTMAKGRPFGFLDHNLRHGDSLLGIHRLDQLTMLVMNPDVKEYQLRIFGDLVEKSVAEAVDIRKSLRNIPIRDIRDVETMARLDSEARKKLEAVELVADAMISEALRCGANAAKLETALDALAVRVGDFLNGNNEMGISISRQSREALCIDLHDRRPTRKPFHWPLEYPEIFARENGGFDVVVGNPPYSGGKKIARQLGRYYREYLLIFIAGNRKGSADLCAYFVLRNWSLINSAGYIGVLATSSMAEGDTREVCLDFMLSHGVTIYRAIQSQTWPGSASVTVTPIWLTRHKYSGVCRLNDNDVKGINAYLCEYGLIVGNPCRLNANSGLSFQGTVVHGKGFVLKKDEAAALIAKNPNNRDVIQPYLRGEDFNSNPDQTPSTYVINFRDWPIEKANKYPDCLKILTEKVKPIRDEIVARGEQIHEYDYWKFWDKRLESYAKIARLERVMFHSFTSKYVAFSFVLPTYVFAAPHVVIGLNGFEYFAVLQSNIHESWVRRYTSYSLSLARYTPTDCFETFPFPNNVSVLDEIGEEYFKYRQELMLSKQIGLINIYNCYHDSNEKSQDILTLRELHAKMDMSVVAAYDWADLDLKHNFYDTKDGIRYTISTDARREVLQRLLKLNHERYEEEVRQGLHDKKIGNSVSSGRSRAKKAHSGNENQTDMLDVLDRTPDKNE